MTSGPRRVQDDAREMELARMLELRPSDRRIGPDAFDRDENPYELKTTTGNSLGTGRDVGVPFLNAMRSRYLVAAKGQQTQYGFTFDELFFLHPDDMEDWIVRIERRLRADLDTVEAAVQALAEGGAEEAQIIRLRAIGERGITLNNPKIPWDYIRTHGVRLGVTPALDLRELVAARPLAGVGPSPEPQAGE